MGGLNIKSWNNRTDVMDESSPYGAHLSVIGHHCHSRLPKAVQSRSSTAAKTIKSQTWPETALLTGGEFHSALVIGENMRQTPGLVLLYGHYWALLESRRFINLRWQCVRLRQQ